MNQANRNRSLAAGSGLTALQRKQVKRILTKEIETKFYQSSMTPNAVSNSGTIALLSGVSQGVTHSGRVGDVMSLKSLQFNFDCIASQTTLGGWLGGDAYNNMRLIIFRWHQNTAAGAPILSDVLTTLTSYTYLAPYNEDNLESGVLKILYDKTFILENSPYWNGSTTLFASGQSSIHNAMNVMISKSKLGPQDVVFNDTATTGIGHVYSLMVSDSAATPHPYAQASYTLKYSDA
jgi:hypothetical protein